ncbi:hypothetical protein [Streptomonospora wellingtoniae]|uniref:Uncharacterized protein n=1 Tax=Streptomonospora wellingtoniae TaxID=3075544 RepID=A0ABU2KRN9_9ACTN|nr:hypothetical protein [Streptomonospora sp. DSM 45055]MDT0301837.1 hypothetical protein [Streptomonospora sp. DSM 45055]
MSDTPSTLAPIGEYISTRYWHVATIAVLAWGAAACLLLGPVPVFGEGYGDCGFLWEAGTRFPEGRCAETETDQVVYAGIAILVAGPTTASWLWRAVLQEIRSRLTRD